MKETSLDMSNPQPPAPSHPLAPGTAAPAFDLASGPDGRVALSALGGRPVVLVFYPSDWSPVCGDQLALYNEMSAVFEEYRARVIGISVDGVWCHRAFREARGIQFPLLADFEPKGAVASRYGVYRDKDGISERALFVIDAAGIVRWSYVAPIGVNPGADDLVSALKSLTPGQQGATSAAGGAA